MHFIKITDKNFMSIAGRVKKFMHHQDVVTWHNYRNGRRIQADFIMTHNRSERIRPIQRYTGPEIQIVTPKSEPIFNRYFIRFLLDEDNGGIIHIGDEIKFDGNRICIKSEYFIRGKGQYFYQVFQRWDPNGGFKDIEPCIPMGFDADDWIY